MRTGRYLLGLCALAATLASAQPLTGIVKVSAGNGMTCALTNAAGVKCWGGGYAATPVDVPGLAGIQDIAVGYSHACALTAAGGVKCWTATSGTASFPWGSLGDGTTNYSATPVDVAGLSSGVVGIDAGGGNTCALLATGGLRCWGLNVWGQIGNGTNDLYGAAQTTPADVVGLSSGVTAVSLGGNHTCAIAGGAVKCWGYAGAMGYFLPGNASFTTTPVDVPGMGSGAVALASGAYHQCALMATGAVKCWGSGLLGDGETRRTSLLADVQGLAPNVVEITAGSGRTCARTSTGRVQCWGSGSIGDVSNDARLLPTDVFNLNAVQISADAFNTCAVIPGNEVRCWGSATGGVLGNGATTGAWSYPVAVGTFAQQQTVAFPGGLAPRHVGEAPFALTATSSSGLPPQFVSVTPSICTVAGSSVTPVGMGICMVAAIQPGDSATAAAPAVPHWFLVHGSPSPRLANLSTRMRFDSFNQNLIAGFIIGGTAPKTVALRARGPSLAASGVAQPHPNPYLMLHYGDGSREDNDDWQIFGYDFMQVIPNFDAPKIQDIGFAPGDVREAAMIRTLKPGAYTAMIPGSGNTGVAILELFELDRPDSPFINIASRGPVRGGEGVLIAGFIIDGNSPQTVVVRARGPTLAQAGVTGVLSNPQLQLFSGPTQIGFNDDWQQASNAAQVQASGFAPADPAESAILITLQPGAYTAIMSGVGGAIGEGIVEVFRN